MNLAIDKRAEQRRRRVVQSDRQHAGRQAEDLAYAPSMREALRDRPELMSSLQRLLKGTA